jgi:hypothetical protein
MAVAISAVCVGALLAALQGVTLFVVSDLRDRIMRIESREMQKADRLRELQGVT